MCCSAPSLNFRLGLKVTAYLNYLLLFLYSCSKELAIAGVYLKKLEKLAMFNKKGIERQPVPADARHRVRYRVPRQADLLKRQNMWITEQCRGIPVNVTTWHATRNLFVHYSIGIFFVSACLTPAYMYFLFVKPIMVRNLMVFRLQKCFLPSN